MRRRIVSSILACAVMASCSIPVFATDTNGVGNGNYQNNTVTYLFAERQAESYSGSGNIQTQTDTRTQAQKEDDANKARIDELAGLIEEATNQLNEGSAQIGTEFDKAFTDYSFTPIDHNYTLQPFSDIELPQYELPDWTLPELPPLTELPGWNLPELPELNLPDWSEIELKYPEGIPYMGDGTKVIDKPLWVPVDNGYAIVEQVFMPIPQIQTMLQIESLLNDTTINPDIISNLPTMVTDKEDLIGPILEPYQFYLDEDMLRWFEDMMRQWEIEGQQRPGAGDLLNNPNLQGLVEYFNGNISIKPIGDMQVAVPTRYDVLYARLMEYLLELQRLGYTTVCVNRITVYNVQTYAYRCIRRAVPHNDYRWQVSGPSGSVEKHTETNYLKILFQSAGTYDVDIFNVQDVTRNNRVSGKKSVVWTMGQGDVFDGLVLYNHTTTFNSFVADDIGPTTEEVRLVNDSFTANVTQQMLNKIQMIDTNGNIHTTTDGFTTERH